jgi:nicotinate-nucleotide adenylyltransferase
MKIGVFGGTFDPPHIGHQILAAEAAEQLNLDQVLWVLTPYPPHKTDQEITPLENRLIMVEIALSGNKEFALSKIDINRKPPHYAKDTLALLRNQSPDDEFYYLMGLDSLNDLKKWHMPAEFIDLCHGIGVMLRIGENLDTEKIFIEFPGLYGKLYLLKIPIIEISSSEIRTRIKMGEHFRYFVLEDIYQYILKNRLYQG